jgi:hypothetical protein
MYSVKKVEQLSANKVPSLFRLGIFAKSQINNLEISITKYFKTFLAPLLYRHYPIRLQPERLYFWLDSLKSTQQLSGVVVEVGVANGGTAAFARNFLRRTGSMREYLCIDTFDGFVRDQFEEDVKLGNSWKNFHAFSANSMSLVRQVLNRHGATDVKLLKSDISKMQPDQLPAKISACLLDVDLAVPIYDGLKLIWPLLEDGGIIVVDDCDEDNQNEWQALNGYVRFCEENNLDQNFFFGVGYIRKSAG